METILWVEDDNSQSGDCPRVSSNGPDVLWMTKGDSFARYGGSDKQRGLGFETGNNDVE